MTRKENESIAALFDAVNFRIERAGEKLAIAIAQDAATNEVLMVAFMNRAALAKTIETGEMHYFSTSRKKLWFKGESSGHIQRVRDMLLDCDGDALLFKVEQSVGSCHKGYYSCFFRKVENGKLKLIGRKVFEPSSTYKR
ncbi:MAG: phosphoribosyl-AMP cyclohydrolase [Candidatus Hydrothermarchaeaceae archaeon]